MYRTVDFNEVLAEELKDGEFRKEYLLSLINGDDFVGPMELHEALIMIAKTMGVTEFAELTDMHRAGVSRFISQGTRPKVDTLEKMLKPFGLKVKIDVEEAS